MVRFARFALLLGLLQPLLYADVVSPDTLLEKANSSISNVNTAQLQKMLAEHPNALIIDVRTPEEVHLLGGKIEAPRSYNIPRGWLEFRVPELVEAVDEPIIVYCGLNQRSPLAAKSLMEMGYSNVHNYADGFFVWREANLPIEEIDKDLNTALFSKPVEVVPGVYSAIGATEPASYENNGHNNNLSFIVTAEGVVVINSGDNYLLAQALHEEIKQITDQPVKYVFLENAQGHAAGGNAYWKEQGATIIAHDDATAEWQAHGEAIVERILARMRDKSVGTRWVMPDESFSDKRVLELGGVRIEALHLGPAHSPGDISIWLPEQSVVIAGDMAFHQRMLPIFEDTDTKAWLETWPTFEALGAQVVVPGHGEVTNMDEVTKYTAGYLRDMREQIGAFIDDGGFLEEVVDAIDQSAYRHLDTYDELYALNASRIYRVMEFEF